MVDNRYSHVAEEERGGGIHLQVRADTSGTPPRTCCCDPMRPIALPETSVDVGMEMDEKVHGTVFRQTVGGIVIIYLCKTPPVKSVNASSQCVLRCPPRKWTTTGRAIMQCRSELRGRASCNTSGR